ncbi:conserved hypothetical protein [Listeria innocua FSL S4-378]|nr:conserved hypothetical protein [Listeria innocua FSL S4-378]
MILIIRLPYCCIFCACSRTWSVSPDTDNIIITALFLNCSPGLG